MLPKVLLVGNSDEFQFSMKLFPEMLQRLLQERGVPVELIRPKTYFGKLAPWVGPLGKWLFYVDKFLIFPMVLKAAIRREQAPGLVVHICDHSNGMYVSALAGTPHVVTCHDLMPIRSALGEIPQNPTSWTGRRFQSLILRGLKKARFIVCVSTATQSDVLRIARYPEARTCVIFNSLHYPFTPMPESEARSRVAALTGSDAPYLLHVGGDAWYKNRPGLLAIYAGVRQRLKAQGSLSPKLVYTGPSLERELQSFLDQDPAMERDVIRAQGVDQENLRALYSRAELLLFPSWDEGFGWPIIEAQACGCRAVTTRKPPMTEVGGDAAFYIDPHEPECAAETVLGLLGQSSEARRSAEEKGLANAARFTPSRMIEQYIEVYRQLIETEKTAQ